MTVADIIERYYKPGDRIHSLNLGWLTYKGVTNDGAPIRKRMEDGTYPASDAEYYFKTHTKRQIVTVDSVGHIIYFNEDGSINTNGTCMLTPGEMSIQPGWLAWHGNIHMEESPYQKYKKAQTPGKQNKDKIPQLKRHI